LAIGFGDGVVNVTATGMEPTVSNVLQRATDLVSADWVDVSLSAGDGTNTWSNIPMTGTNAFFRVRSGGAL